MEETVKAHKDLKALWDDPSEDNHKNIRTYLKDLQERLKLTIHRHTTQVQQSVSIIKELTEVTTMLSTINQTGEEETSNIKRLIVEFEHFHAGDNMQEAVHHTRCLIEDYSRLDESHLLPKSLMCLKVAKESLEKVDELWSQLSDSTWKEPTVSTGTLTSAKSSCTSLSLRDKIRAFNRASEQGENALQKFSQCFSGNCDSTGTP